MFSPLLVFPCNYLTRFGVINNVGSESSVTTNGKMPAADFIKNTLKIAVICRLAVSVSQ